MMLFIRNNFLFGLIPLLLLHGCGAGLGNRAAKNNQVQTDSSLIEPVSVNNLFLDSIAVADFLIKHPEFKNQQEQAWKFYQRRNYQFAWFNNDGITEHAANFMNMLMNYREEGITDTTVFNPQLKSLYDSLSSGSHVIQGVDPLITETELLLSASFFKYAQQIWGGLGEKELQDVDWYIKQKRLPYVALLDSMLSNPQYFSQQKPVYRQYDLLKSQLKKYHELEQSGSWQLIVADKKSYKTGDSSTVINAIRKRLFLLGDLASTDTTSNIYDSTLVIAVKNFQDRHGLATDGVIGISMITALNVPLSSRIQQIMINMERSRWVPVQLKGDYLAVNIPEYKLHVYDDDSLVWECNVVVGSVNNQTVIFNGNMKYIVFSPYWNIPTSIIAKEIVPGAKRNANYIASHNMEVVAGGKVISPSSVNWSNYSGYNFPYAIRQKPGPNNSLGRVKFLFPNNYSIYLHDTPSKSLFNEPARAFSHGCIRVGEPVRLAEYLLRNDSLWTPEKIAPAMNSTKETTVTLKTPVPVFIAYFTAWVDRKGRINFRNDIYGHDGRMAKLLFNNPTL
ncbi:MAG: L,D-transpeptidase family protein [Chitinophagaceae bacterium]|nr:L,D-transpeptidase family protein [Chitinophagaceae bacterium]